MFDNVLAPPPLNLVDANEVGVKALNQVSKALSSSLSGRETFVENIFRFYHTVFNITLLGYLYVTRHIPVMQFLLN